MAVCLGGNQIDSRCLLSEEKEGQSVIIGVFYKLVLMEILYLGLTWPLLQFSLASLKYNNLLRDKCKIGSS